jgi:hypothetical protein
MIDEREVSEVTGVEYERLKRKSRGRIMGMWTGYKYLSLYKPLRLEG